MRYLALIFLTTCNPARMISPTHHYDVYVGNEFSDIQKQEINNAFLEWERSTNDSVSFSFIGGKNYSNPLIVVELIPSSQIKEIFNHHTIGRTEWRGFDSYIVISSSLNDRDFQQVILHEIGHAIGLDHGDNETAMGANTELASMHLTQKDLNSFYYIFGN